MLQLNLTVGEVCAKRDDGIAQVIITAKRKKIKPNFFIRSSLIKVHGSLTLVQS